MRKTGTVLLTVALAMAVAPLRLPAASCILSNAPSENGCKPRCCANMKCCALAGKNKSPGSQPLAQSDAAKQQLTVLLATLPAPTSGQLVRVPNFSPHAPSIRAHSPPPLAANCIRLI